MSELSEHDAALVGRWIARAFLEVERGQRSPWTLERFVTPLVLRTLSRTPTQRYAATLRAEDVGGVTVSVRPAGAYVTVGIVAPHGKRDALLIELRRFGDGWTVVDLTRLSWRCQERLAASGRGEHEALAS